MDSVSLSTETDISFSSSGSAIRNARQAINIDGHIRWLTPDGPGDVVRGRYNFITTESGDLFLYPAASEEYVNLQTDENSSEQDLDLMVRNIVNFAYDTHGFPRGEWIADFKGGTSSVDPAKEWMSALLRNLVPLDKLIGIDPTNAHAVASLIADAMRKAPEEKRHAFGADGHIDHDCYNQGPELDPRTQRTFSSQLGMFYSDQNLQVPAERQRGIDHLFDDVWSENMKPKKAPGDSPRLSRASSSSAISMTQLDSKENPLECDSRCWLRLLEADYRTDQSHLLEKSLPDNTLNEFEFRYSPLTETQFRLLKLQPSEDEADPIRCVIDVAQLPTKMNDSEDRDLVVYEALSYTWGENDNLQTIVLNSASFHVTPNLYSALRQLRRKDSTRTLWIDAICIYQGDEDEKSQQVQHMKLIYERAVSVVVWLGPEFEQGDLAIKAMRKLDDKSIRQSTFQRSHPESCMLNLQKIFFAQLAVYRRAYFRRTWIRQEIASAGRIIVHCGRETLSWNLLRRSKKCLPRISKKLDSEGVQITPEHHAESYSTTYLDTFGWLKQHWSPGQATLQQFGDIRSLWYYHAGGLLELLMANRGYDATNQRDKVYAVLGMAEVPLQAGKIDSLEEHTNDTMIVDYSASVPAVYQYLAKYLINRDRNLDILCILSTHRNQNSTDLPTWTPDWRVPTREISMKECFDYFAEKFGAAGFTEALPQLYNMPNMLFAAGHCLDEIGTLSNATTSARHMFAYLEDGQIYANEFHEDKHLRRCGHTHGGSLPCLVPCDSRVGDEIWILHGGKLPFVLRKAETYDRSLDEHSAFGFRIGDIEDRYEVVGPCCVPEYMYGKAISSALERELSPLLLVLV